MGIPFILGLGVVCNLGTSKKEVVKNILTGNAGIGEASRFDVRECTARYIGEVDNKKTGYRDSFKRRLIDRCANYLLHACREALDESGISLSKIPAGRIGIVLGTSLAGTELGEEFYEQHKLKRDRVHLNYLNQYPLYSCADILSSKYKIEGPKVVISTACSSSATAIGYAGDLIRLGMADVVITGGGDPLTRLSYAGFYCLGNLSDQRCSPFSDTSTGLSLGEGAGVLILGNNKIKEEFNSPVYGYVAGYSIMADAYHPTAPEPQGRGAFEAMSAVIKRAGLEERKSEIRYINAHGTGTRHNDQVESRVIHRIFPGETEGSLSVSSTKSMTGHILGGSGAVEVVISCLGMKNDFLPPTINFTNNRQGCDLDYIPNKAAVDVSCSNFISNSFAFGGNNVSVLISKNDPGGKWENAAESLSGDPIVVSGIGCISALGNSIDEIYEKIISGIHAIAPEEEVVQGYCRNASTKSCRIRDFSLRSVYRFKNARRMDRVSQLAVGAGYLALKDANFTVNPVTDKQIGLVYGTGTGPVNTLVSFFDPLVEKGLGAGQSALFANTVANAAAGYIGIETKIKGHTTVVTNGHASGLIALIMGCHFIRMGYCKHVLVGSSDEYSTALHKGLLGLGAITPAGEGLPEAMYPLGEKRNGIIIGEASCFLFIEPKSEALAAGRKIYCEIDGYGIASDVCKVSRNDMTGKGMALAVKKALETSSAEKEDIGIVYPSAGGYIYKDGAEGAGISQALGRMPVSLLTPYVGDVNGSIGLLALGIGTKAFEGGVVPGGLEDYPVDPAIDLEIIRKNRDNPSKEYFMVTANSYGGLNSAIILRKK